MTIKFYPQPDGCIGVKIMSELRNEQFGDVLPPSALKGDFAYALPRLIEGMPPKTRKGHDPWHGVVPEPLFRPQNIEPDM